MHDSQRVKLLTKYHSAGSHALPTAGCCQRQYRFAGLASSSGHCGTTGRRRHSRRTPPPTGLRRSQGDERVEEVQVAAHKHQGIQLLRLEGDACSRVLGEVVREPRSALPQGPALHRSPWAVPLGFSKPPPGPHRPRQDLVARIFSSSTMMDSRCVMSPASRKRFIAAVAQAHSRASATIVS